MRCNNKHLCHQRAGCGPATSRIAFHDKHCCAQMQANLHTQYERASVVRASQPNSLSGRRFAQRSIQAAYPACESGEPRQHCRVHSTALRCRRTSCAVSPARLSPPWKQAAVLKSTMEACRHVDDRCIAHSWSWFSEAVTTEARGALFWTCRVSHIRAPHSSGQRAPSADARSARNRHGPPHRLI